jgi:hypothetical protein
VYDLPAFVDAASAAVTSAYCARLKPVTGLLAYIIAACAAFTLVHPDHQAHQHNVTALYFVQSKIYLPWIP